MARIRSIKPEFPQSESMGRVSRDARLLFIELWTIADDFGRLRGNSRMLASLLFPYDDDAPGLMDSWLGELEHEGCIERYQADGQNYLQISNWLIHQKIDRPSASKLPAPANPREESRARRESFPRKGEEGKGEEGKGKDRDREELPGLVAPSPGKPSFAGQARDILDFLNAKAGRAYKPVDGNLNFIIARLKDGATPDDCRGVIAKKCREWKGSEKMDKFLRPETLFNATKFASYQGELVEPENGGLPS